MRLRDLLRAHADVFAWTTTHITGVPRTLIIREETFSTEHQLNVFNHTEPVKQKKRSLAPERNEVVRTQVEELVEAGVLREVKYQTWVSNPIIVKKDDGKWKLRIDFTNINKACIREPHPLPAAELGAENLHKYRLKCFLDTYKGYHQIPMAEKDEEKTAFFTREGVFLLQKATLRFKKCRGHLSETHRQSLRYVPRSLKKERKCSINGRKGEETGSCIFCKSDNKQSRTKVPRVGKAHTCPRVRRKEALKIFPREHEIEFKGRNSIKGQILADFLAETSPTEREEEKNGEAKRKEPEPENTWKLFTDGASSSDGSGAGLMLVNPEGKEYTYALRFEFETTNNEAEYEALIAGLRIAKEMQIQELAIFVDSQLVANQVKGLFEARQQTIKQYLEKTMGLLSSFPSYSIEHIKREHNKKADALNKLASMTFSKLAKEVLVEVIQTKSVAKKEITDVVKEDEDSWMVPIQEYLKEEILPKDSQKARKLCIKSPLYRMIEERLYQRSYMSPWLRCVGPMQAKSIIKEVHERSCGYLAQQALKKIIGCIKNKKTVVLLAIHAQRCKRVNPQV
ncbi:reverse transcriptase domain-containing protein [Tanacetum coccineum]